MSDKCDSCVNALVNKDKRLCTVLQQRVDKECLSLCEATQSFMGKGE